jgi:myo-inositol-1(or 4)-monophosphatase
LNGPFEFQQISSFLNKNKGIISLALKDMIVDTSFITRVEKIITSVKDILPERFAEDLDEKGLNQLVTQYDKAVESRLIEEFTKLTPNATFLSEEENPEAIIDDLTWVIDPIDGTTNFIHNNPMYSVSIALYQGEKPILGVVYLPKLNEYFLAHQEGAFLNNRPIKVSKNQALKSSLMATGFPYYDFEKTKQYFLVLESLMKQTRGVRRMGSAAIDLAYTACGRFDGFFEYSLSPWDVAAGAYIVKQAGGKVSDFNGGDNFIFGKEIIAASDSIYSSLYQYVHKYLSS